MGDDNDDEEEVVLVCLFSSFSSSVVFVLACSRNGTRRFVMALRSMTSLEEDDDDDDDADDDDVDVTDVDELLRPLTSNEKSVKSMPTGSKGANNDNTTLASHDANKYSSRHFIKSLFSNK